LDSLGSIAKVNLSKKEDRMKNIVTAIQKLKIHPAAIRQILLSLVVAGYHFSTANAQIGVAFTKASSLCKDFVVPGVLLVVLFLAIVGVMKGVQQLQNEENGWRTIVQSIIFGAIAAGVPAVAGGLVTIPGAPAGAAFCA
jgi:hypothetical protein